MTDNNVDVFVGDPVGDPGEKAVLARLREDLRKREVSATLVANFHTVGKQLQIDLVAITASRMAQIEIKTYSQSLPLLAPTPNGPWKHRLPTGELRQLDGNPAQQALNATFALSDDMRTCARRGTVPDATHGKFAKDIDTLVCLNPQIPPGSELMPVAHVTVVGYDDLLDRLCTPGPRPPWSATDISKFLQFLHVYPEADDSDSARLHRAHMNTLDDYRQAFLDLTEPSLPVLVPMSSMIEEGQSSEPLHVLLGASGESTTLVLGASGMGKSHLAAHAAVHLARAGQLPVWVRCREHQPGRQQTAVSRALAPFTTASTGELFAAAHATGARVVVVFDGFNECSAEAQSELLEQMQTLRKRAGAAVVITSTEAPQFAEHANVRRLTLEAPTSEERAALALAYGADDSLDAEAFTTRFELALAAQCRHSLPPDATRTELFDTFVRSVCPQETVRDSMRIVAHRITETLQLALPATEALTLVRAAHPTAPHVVDALLNSPLLEWRQGRVSFKHETFTAFLTAEHLAGASPRQEWIGLLRRGTDTALTEFTVALTPDGSDRAALVTAIGQPALLAEAARGRLGPSTGHEIRNAIIACLRSGAIDAADADFTPSEAAGFGVWSQPAARSPEQQALVRAAGRCLLEGELIEEVADLLDATDARCAGEIGRLQALGSAAPRSTVVGGTYNAAVMSGERATSELAATVLLRELSRRRLAGSSADRPNSPDDLLQRLLAVGSAPRWGRLMTALLLTDTVTDAELELLPRLISDAWQAGGYHLRLQAIDSAWRCAHRVTGELRDRVLEVLNSFDVSSNIWLSSTLVDALAAYGAIEPIATVDEIVQGIRELLAAAPDASVYDAARGVISAQFDPEAVVGPYYEAIERLSDAERLRLYLLAVESEYSGMDAGWTIRHIAELATPADLDAVEVLRRHVQEPDLTNPFTQEPIRAHDAALAWFARYNVELPATAPTGDLTRHAWSALDRMVWAKLAGRPLPVGEAERQWDELLQLCPLETAQVVELLQLGATLASLGEVSPLEVLINDYPDQMRLLQEWVIKNTDPPTSVSDGPRWRDRRELAYRLLERVGTSTTAAWLRLSLNDPVEGRVVAATVHAIERRLHGLT